MIILDGIELPSLVWTDQYTASAVGQTMRRTLDGGIVVYYGPLHARPITLESAPDAGWITRSQADALALRASSPGARYTLTINDQVFEVMFRHHEPPAFEAVPLWPGSDYHTVTLKLMTI